MSIPSDTLGLVAAGKVPLLDFTRKQSEVIDEVRLLQADMPDLCLHGSHQSVSTGPLIPGCAICTRAAYMCFQVGFRCNARCPFCFLNTGPADAFDEGEDRARQALLAEFHSRKHNLEGVALTGGEPFLYLPELEACVLQMRRARPDLHLWLYTNGILADRERLTFVHDIGVHELRFNLAATDYDPKTLANLEQARSIFEYVAVEVPSYPVQKGRLMACLADLDRIGIDQLNLQELLVTSANVDRLQGEGYQSGILLQKRFFLYGSRRMTYEVMRHCIDTGCRFTVNDCSVAQFGLGQ